MNKFCARTQIYKLISDIFTVCIKILNLMTHLLSPCNVAIYISYIYRSVRERRRKVVEQIPLIGRMLSIFLRSVIERIAHDIARPVHR